MVRIMLPTDSARAETARETRTKVSMEAPMMEEADVHEETAAKPAAAPAPTQAPSAEAYAPSREKSAEVNAWVEPKAECNRRIPERRIVAPRRRTPNVCGIVLRHINVIRIRRFDHHRPLS